jgi:Fe-Mn family superoxide dismutase
MTIEKSRRQFLQASSAGFIASALGATTAQAQLQRADAPSMSIKAFHTEHDLKPLAFESSALDGLSARLIDSHWANNYGGSVRTLNAVNKRQTDALAATDTPAFIYNDLKREHLMRTGSVILHEYYFDNLGGDGKAPGLARSLLAASFGDFDRWETEYRKIGAGLGGGAGWVVLAYNRHFHAFENYWMADHMHSPADSVPLLVMDMYEHSYQLDYGSATARYIDAFFNNINWDEVMLRIETLA